MTDTQNTPVGDLVGRTAVDADGEKVGEIFDVYLDNETDQPEWLAVKTGMFGSKLSFVPIGGATMVGDDVQVSFRKDQVKDAPKAEADGELSPEEETELYTHYGRSPQTAAPSGGGKKPRGDKPDQGRDTSGASTDEAMTRSEEELDVTTTKQEKGKARIRKWVETENVQMTVPIRREKARMVTETITDANRGAAMGGPEITEDEHVVTLSEEVVDVQKSVVPKERVRLETEVETEDVTVDEEVRKERIEMDDDDDGRNKP